MPGWRFADRAELTAATGICHQAGQHSHRPKVAPDQHRQRTKNGAGLGSGTGHEMRGGETRCQPARRSPPQAHMENLLRETLLHLFLEVCTNQETFSPASFFGRLWRMKMVLRATNPASEIFADGRWKMQERPSFHRSGVACYETAKVTLCSCSPLEFRSLGTGKVPLSTSTKADGSSTSMPDAK
jgi:hypothetical protein